jgi:response regulator NasT
MTRWRVLIADNEALMRLELSAVLAEDGFEVVGCADDSAQALALAAEIRPDLVIMDAVTLSQAGVDAAKNIIGREIAPVVVLVPASHTELTGTQQDSDGVAFLPRQFAKSELLPAIEVAAARFTESRTLKAQVADAAERERAQQVVRRAKELMIAQQHMTEVDAADWLRRAAARRQTALHDIAEMVVDGLTATA